MFFIIGFIFYIVEDRENLKGGNGKEKKGKGGDFMDIVKYISLKLLLM